MGRINVIVTTEIHKQLKQLAIEKDIPLKKLVEDVLSNYAKRARK